MRSHSEVGNLKNVTNFGTLISFATGYGPSYAPSNTAILLTALGTKKATAESDLNLVKDTAIPLLKVRAIRKALFEPLPTLTTRVVSIFQSSGAPKEIVEKAKAIKRKIEGRRAPAKSQTSVEGRRAPAKSQTSVEGRETPGTISVSQRSYDRQADFFLELIKLAENEVTYTPSETDLQVSNMLAYQQQLIRANEDVKDAFTPFSNAQIALHTTLYEPLNGLIDLAFATKNYIKGVFGAGSLQYAQVRAIQFTRSRR